MHIHQIIKSDTSNGIGTRISIFVSGCQLNCPGCHNKAGQNFTCGEPFTEQIKLQIFEEFRNISVYDGITILGGDPMETKNKKSVFNLLYEFKEQFPNKTIWIYTGRIYELIKEDSISHAILNLCDVLVDGPFILAKKNLLLEYRGSENQRIIDLNASRIFQHTISMDFDRHDRITTKG